MSKQSSTRGKTKKPNYPDKAPEQHGFWYKLFRFFVPKNFRQEIERGKYIGMQIQSGNVPPEVFETVPTFWLGKLLRKIIDPKHKMKFEKEKDNTDGQEE